MPEGDKEEALAKIEIDRKKQDKEDFIFSAGEFNILYPDYNFNISAQELYRFKEFLIQWILKAHDNGRLKMEMPSLIKCIYYLKILCLDISYGPTGLTLSKRDNGNFKPSTPPLPEQRKF